LRTAEYSYWPVVGGGLCRVMVNSEFLLLLKNILFMGKLITVIYFFLYK